MSRNGKRPEPLEGFDWSKVKPGTPMTIWVRPALDPRTGVQVSPPVIWTGRFLGLDQPVPEVAPWIVVDAQGGSRAGFPPGDVAQVQQL